MWSKKLSSVLTLRKYLRNSQSSERNWLLKSLVAVDHLVGKGKAQTAPELETISSVFFYCFLSNGQSNSILSTSVPRKTACLCVPMTVCRLSTLKRLHSESVAMRFPCTLTPWYKSASVEGWVWFTFNQKCRALLRRISAALDMKSWTVGDWKFECQQSKGDSLQKCDWHFVTSLRLGIMKFRPKKKFTSCLA